MTVVLVLVVATALLGGRMGLLLLLLWCEDNRGSNDSLVAHASAGPLPFLRGALLQHRALDVHVEGPEGDGRWGSWGHCDCVCVCVCEDASVWREMVCVSV